MKLCGTAKLNPLILMHIRCIYNIYIYIQILERSTKYMRLSQNDIISELGTHDE